LRLLHDRGQAGEFDRRSRLRQRSTRRGVAQGRHRDDRAASQQQKQAALARSATAKCYLIRDRDGIYGAAVPRRLRAMGIRDKPIAAGSPWQNGYVERLIGTIRRECLDHMIVFGEAHLCRFWASMPPIIMGREFTARWTRMHRSIARLSALAS